MREAEVTDEAIIEAGKRLMERGRKVTKSGLRQALGAGNFDRLLAVWMAHEAATQQSKRDAATLPPELEHSIQSAVERFAADLRARYVAVSDAAMQAADERVRGIEEACRRKLEAAAEDAAAAERENERLDAELQAATAELEQLRARNDEAYRELQEVRNQQSKLKDQLIEAQGEGRLAEVELRVQQNLVAEIGKERDQLREQHLQQLMQAQGEVAVVREQLAHAQGQIKVLTQQLEALTRQVGAQAPQGSRSK